ncbi:hypothetical protein EDD21DRAFT_449425 [Dissophora ornata]|nr:hypothetical protein EDD21DRAFT_449425 [Dissophora ornata]
MYKDIELSNVEFKRTDISSRNIALQCRKNVRLGRCLQEAHATYGFKDASVIMGDVAGFVGLFYQVKPMREVSIAEDFRLYGVSPHHIWCSGSLFGWNLARYDLEIYGVSRRPRTQDCKSKGASSDRPRKDEVLPGDWLLKIIDASTSG